MINLIEVSVFEQKQIFIEHFKSAKYSNASSIYLSQKIYDQAKIFNVFEYYKLYNSFKIIKDNQVDWELERSLIVQEKMH